jgi:hypothetical protein
MNRISEVDAMKMLGRCDQDSIDARVIQQVTVIRVGFDAWRFCLGALQMLSIDVAHTRKFRIGATERFAGDGAAAVSISDDTESDSVVCAENIAGNSRETAKAAGHSTEKCATRIHKNQPFKLMASVASVQRP